VTQAARQTKTAVAAEIAMLMVRYSFDLGNYSPEQWINQWLQQYPDLWLHGAVVEALYQGRYKAVSVWQILDLWQRRGKPLRHFSREFERMVAGHTLQLLVTPDTALSPNYTAESYAAENHGSTHPSSALSRLILPSSLSPLQSQIQPYKPSLQFQLALPEKITLLQHQTWPVHQPPIQRFVPTPETSEFHSKLKSIAQLLILNNVQLISTTLTSRQIQMPEDAELKDKDTEPISESRSESGLDQQESEKPDSEPDCSTQS